MMKVIAALIVVFFAALTGLAAMAALSTHARAQTICGPLPDLLAALARRYDERTVFEGKTGNGGKLILTLAPDGTWTVLSVSPGGEPACALGGGKDGALTGKPA